MSAETLKSPKRSREGKNTGSAASTLLIANRQRRKKINVSLLKRITVDLLAGLEIPDAQLEINLVAAPEMAALNETFLDHEGSTDVITFDYSPPGPRTPDPRPGIHGEIFVCIDDAIAQAKQFKTTWPTETARYVVHGVLHLLGHDDLRADLRRRMKREENRLLRGLAKKFSLAQIERRPKISR